MEDIKYLYREFLNNDPYYGGTAMVFAKVSRGSDDKYTWANLSISNCYETIDLDIVPYDPEGGDDEAGFKNCLGKLDHLLCAVIGLKRALLEDAASRGFLRDCDGE